MATQKLYGTWSYVGDVRLQDSDNLYFGTGQDVQIRWDGTDLDILAATDDSVIKFGNGTKNFDVWFYGNTASDNVIFDASANQLKLDGVDLILEDSDYIQFGDAQDAQIAWDATRLVLEPKYTLHIGASTDTTFNQVHIFDGTTASGPSTVVLYDENGTARYLWVDNTGDVRVHTAHPGTDSTSTGTIVGTQA
jgi:hypothetical protein